MPERCPCSVTAFILIANDDRKMGHISVVKPDLTDVISCE